MDQARGVLGIIGFPIGHSLSPHMHNWAAKHFGLDLVYVPFEVKPESLEQAISGIKALGIKGINVTIPYKERVVPFLDACDPEAEMLQAVNTIVLRENRLIGFNTDGKGFVNSLYEELGLKLKDKRCLLLGAGGAAKALGFYLALSGVKDLFIANRDMPKAVGLVANIKNRFAQVLVQALPLTEEALSLYLPQVDIIINATSLGMGGTGIVPLPVNLISEDHVICDIVYHPVETHLLRLAKEKGAKTVNGLGMLAHQGALAFQIWTGFTPPVSELRRILESLLPA